MEEDKRSNFEMSCLVFKAPRLSAKEAASCLEISSDELG